MTSVTATCRGGISVLSAFSTGIGASAGIDLPLTVYMEKGESNERPEILPTLDFLNEKFGKGTDFHVEIDSWIPSAMGLKSSSAFTLGLVLAYSDINGIEMTELEAIELSAEASIVNGTSITGAMDDLCASYYGGICMTDNTARKIIFRKEIDERPVLVMFSEKKIRTGNLKNKDFSTLSTASEGMANMIQEGHIFETMCLNGFLYGSILGADCEMIGRLYESGAIYAGQSGKGPALFSVFSTFEDAELAKEELKSDSYRGIVTAFSNRKAVVELG